MGGDGDAQLKTAIPKLTYFPVKKQHNFKLNKGQTSACLHVYEGDDGAVDNATLLAKVSGVQYVTFIPSVSGNLY